MHVRRGVAALLLAAVCATAAAAGSASEALDSFHKALRKNEPDKVLAVLAKDAVIYEQGFAESSRDEWARKQLGTAIAFARDTERRVLRRVSGSSGDAAWFMSATETVLDVSERKVVFEGAETALLRREGGEWKIVHLHWSAHEAEAVPAVAAPAADQQKP